MKKEYRPNVGLMVLNHAGDVFMARRVDTRKKGWQMPQGGIDEQEDPYTAALRELQEETGITSVSLIAESTHWYTYDFPSDVTFISEKKKSSRDKPKNGFCLNLRATNPKSTFIRITPNFANGHGRPSNGSLI